MTYVYPYCRILIKIELFHSGCASFVVYKGFKIMCNRLPDGQRADGDHRNANREKGPSRARERAEGHASERVNAEDESGEGEAKERALDGKPDDVRGSRQEDHDSRRRRCGAGGWCACFCTDRVRVPHKTCGWLRRPMRSRRTPSSNWAGASGGPDQTAGIRTPAPMEIV
jgi:hypothetical protein